MSGEFAQAEKCPEPLLLPPRRQRLKEIVDLNRKLDAVAILEDLSNAVRGTKIVRGDRPQYYLISYDNATMRVEVEPYSQPLEAVQSYDLAEYSDNTTGANKKNVVLVEADKVEGLKQAYQNYFGDVQLFKRQLTNIVSGKEVREYIIKPQRVAPLEPTEAPDLSWFRRSQFRKPKGA